MSCVMGWTRTAITACGYARVPSVPGRSRPTATCRRFTARSRATAQARPGWTGWVDGHDRAGHATSNPYVRRMVAAPGMGGTWLVAPGSPLWVRWQEALHNRDEGGSTLRLRYPIMTAAEIEKELR